NKVLPVSNGNALFSGGEIYVSAAQGAQQIFMKPATMFQANIPQTGWYDSISNFFSGQVVSDNTTNIINWTFNDTGSHGYIINIGDTIRLFSDSMQWCNADRFISAPDYQTFTVTVNATGNTVSASDNLIAYVM